MRRAVSTRRFTYHHITNILVNPARREFGKNHMGGQMQRAGAGCFSIPFDVPPYRLSGTVYGTLLNHRSALAALGDAANRPPYDAPPDAPVLYIKPRNTLGVSGSVVRIPAGIPELEVGACLGLVIGRTACRVSESRALDYVAGYLIVAAVRTPPSRYHPPPPPPHAPHPPPPLRPPATPPPAPPNPHRP